MTEGILDALLMILVLAIVTALSFTLIIPLTNSDIMSYNEVLEDKGLVKDVRAGGVLNTGAEPDKITYDAREILLTVHVQDENMPLPRAFRVENKGIIKVESDYKMQVLNIGREVWTQLPSKTARYEINYNYADGGSYTIEREN